MSVTELKPGTRIRLLEMPNDPCPIPAGTTGTVTRIQPLDGMGRAYAGTTQVSVKWDIERSLHLVLPKDQIEILEQPTAIQE